MDHVFVTFIITFDVNYLALSYKLPSDMDFLFDLIYTTIR